MTEKRLRQLSILVGQKLKAQGKWITCAESCTGGWVAKALTDIAGSSSYFDRGFVAYSNTAKQELLHVKQSVLMTCGAVSQEVVCAMAIDALHTAAADIALSISGIAGPSGGTVDKPAGTVWFGFASKPGHVKACKKQFTGDRESIRLQAAIFSLQTILDEFLEEQT